MDEAIQFQFDWLEARHKIKDQLQLDKLPDLNAILLFIGIQELGKWNSTKAKKEEKQDLMHIAVCTLMSQDGYFHWDGLDTDGWPHFIQTKKFEISGAEAQESYLMKKVIQYIHQLPTAI
jgi:hypothetical protein